MLWVLTKLISRQGRTLQFEKCWDNYTGLLPIELLSWATEIGPKVGKWPELSQ